MKRCPTCKRMFEDTLSFCLEDGTPLVPAGADSEATLVTPKSDLPPTQVYTPMPGGPASPYQAPQPYPATPSPQRRIWPWILAVAAVFLLGVAAIVVVAIILPGMLHSANDNRSPSPSPLASPSPKPSPSSSSTIEVSDVPTDPEEVQTQLENLENEWERANVEADKATLNRILAREYQGTITPHPGRTWRYRDVELDLDAEKATLTYELDRIDGDNVQTYSYVDTFVWRDHRWQATSSRQV